MAEETPSYSGSEKSAILLLALGDDIAPLVFQHLDDQEIQRISNHMSYIRNVDNDLVKGILEEFAEMIKGSSGMVSGGKEYVRKLLAKSLAPEKASLIFNNLSLPSLETGLEALQCLDEQNIARFLQNEHPQTISVILAHLNPSQAGMVLASLPTALQADVLMRIAKLERIPPGIVQELDQVLRNELKATGVLESGQVGGVAAVAEILNNVDQTSEREIMDQIEGINGNLAEEIRQLMFIFEDLLGIDDRSMQQLLREVSNDDMTLALKTATEELQRKVFRNMSERAATMLREEIDLMGPVRVTDVEKAQQKILQVAKRMEGEGKITLREQGNDALV
jgi:flagellar motor switch protein FliG